MTATPTRSPQAEALALWGWAAYLAVSCREHNAPKGAPCWAVPPAVCGGRVTLAALAARAGARATRKDAPHA